MIRVTIFAAILGLLAACATPGTETVGSVITTEKAENPPGQNTLAFEMAPDRTISILLGQGKDETNVVWRTTWEYPDGTKITGEYTAQDTSGSEAQLGMIAGVVEVAKERNETARELTPALIDGILKGAKLGLTGGASAVID